tara:strand:- start:1193 stop:2125 length:933 start_codon:yes stop_codon:yes gene_type:complete
MKKKIIVEIAEGLGNQLFMYAHAYSMAKKLNYELFIDNQSGYSLNRNTLRKHQNYMLNSFNIAQNYAPNELIYDKLHKKIKKKLLILIDKFKNKQTFFREKFIKTNNSKIVQNYTNLLEKKFSDKIYVQGNFENYEYFNEYKKELSKFFIIKSELINHKNSIVDKLSNNNSISIHIRRNRFSDQIGLTDTQKNKEKSDFFTNQIIEYINRSINFIDKKVQNPKYFIWTNDYEDFDILSNKLIINKYNLINENVINDFDLFRYAKHFIVGPSSFHWWGAWLNKTPNKICIRPSNINPSNNENFWPKDWISI